MEEKLLKCFAKNNFKGQIKQSFELKKQSREKVVKYMSNGKAMIIRLIVGFIKNILLSFIYLIWFFKQH